MRSPHRRGRHDGVLRPTALASLLAVVASACSAVVQLEPGDPVRFVRQPQTSHVLAQDGTVLAELHAEQDRQEIPLERMGEPLVDAVVATEDRRFFLHRGVDLAAIVRAALHNLEAGEIDQGGSTITQQYVKNTMTGPARTLERKVKEAALAYQLEQRYSKEEILERYLNTIYFGHGAYGVHAAARRYFDTTPAEVTLAQAATLAGLIASPSTYDPYADPEAARARRRQVLDAMVAAGRLSRARADRAGDAELDLAPDDRDRRVRAPYFVDEVKRRLQHDPDGRFAAALGEDLDDRVDALFTGGLRVHTTLDLEAQRQARAAVADVLPDGADPPDAALVALTPSTGAVRALVGGRDYHDTGDPQARFNLATQGRRQPGSAFKPVVLATALERGVPLDRVFPGGRCVDFAPRLDWAPCNYADTAYGPLTLREGTVRSVNTVYARLAVDLGPTAIVQKARTLGFRGDLDPVPSLALGTGTVSPLEMASAYAAFATLGERHPPHLIERIETADGETLYQHRDRAHRVLDDAAAFLVNQTLTEVVRRGTGVRARIDRPQAGKTGTSQDNGDAWFVGYTPDLVASVWVGFAEGRVPLRPPRTPIRVEGGRWPAEIWASFATEALDGVPPGDFPTPDVEVVTVEVDVRRNCLPNPYTPPEVVEEREFLAGTAPTERCTEPTGPAVEDVPGVTRLPVDVARRLLTDEGFEVEVRPEFSRLLPPGIVTRQRPEAGGSVQGGGAVVLWASSDVRTRAEVPDVVGLHRTDARARLEEGGWVVEVRPGCPADGCAADASADVVWAQDPQAGAREPEHALVTLRVYPEDGAAG